jgi:hypothetical protein
VSTQMHAFEMAGSAVVKASSRRNAGAAIVFCMPWWASEAEEH